MTTWEQRTVHLRTETMLGSFLTGLSRESGFARSGPPRWFVLWSEVQAAAVLSGSIPAGMQMAGLVSWRVTVKNVLQKALKEDEEGLEVLNTSWVELQGPHGKLLDINKLAGVPCGELLPLHCLHGEFIRWDGVLWEAADCASLGAVSRRHRP